MKNIEDTCNEKYEIGNNLTLSIVKKEERDIKLLYAILQKRPYYHKISHKSLPTYDEHKRFILSHPYRNWFIIHYKNHPIGNFYLTHENVLGIFIINSYEKLLTKIIKFVINNFYPLEEIKSIRPKYFIINVSPDNTQYQKIIESLNGKKIQISYKINSPKIGNNNEN